MKHEILIGLQLAILLAVAAVLYRLSDRAEHYAPTNANARANLAPFFLAPSDKITKFGQILQQPQLV